MLIIPKKINTEIYNYLLSKQYSEFVAKIISARISDIETVDIFLNGSIKDLSSPFLFKGIEKAIDRLYIAIINQEVIGLETDHDCDGQTSHAILYEALTKIFGHQPENIRSYIGHRMKEGYGLSESVMNRILMDDIRPTLIITADNGSTDEPRINVLKQNGIDTIVTDHHAIPAEGVPKSAIAVINPTQSGCKYPDKYIAGCFVAWLFMAGLRRKFIQNNKPLLSQCSLTELLDFAAIGTVADCVSMAKSFNNRIVTKAGIEQLKSNFRKCWDVFDRDKFSGEYIGFTVAPILNSDGRVSDALGSVNFLSADDDTLLKSKFEALKQQNKERKFIQKNITNQAMIMARAKDETHNGICILLDDGHAGVHGISASRLKDTFGKPIIIFSETQSDDSIISGSARSVDDVNIKLILDSINQSNEGLILRYGGHHGAAGLTINKSSFEEFARLFEIEINKMLNENNIILEPSIYYDFELKVDDFSFDTLDQINSLEPYGREFEKPVFYNKFIVENIKFVGADKNHAQLMLRLDNKTLKSIWFNAIDNSVSQNILIGDEIKVCYELQKEEFRSNINISLNIKAVQK